ncbi:TIGR02221 family CRISPR-associated protein [Chitinivibrio alkaliphilus]|uniref:CRISPR/Cas system-associated protein Csx1 n=1 Tax=Chitinivibrio alkaliphilus ACht1 TaxID=1313304 RepID=U7D2P0_9BACT|nr:TIGR02221 family CRISPR-associated protein [Chitinivibrio alkaliphilus]ERP30779.1 CRISPR/Cas system-associated protein Csx1 [Chitinivibrio alkaliphilus ACht1]
MGRKVFISFLGAGNYSPVQYQNSSIKTPYVQTALLHRFGKNYFDKVRILTTPKSEEKHWKQLSDDLRPFITDKTSIEHVPLSEDLANAQWKWFETILNLVDQEDKVWFDMTHGFRAFSIILSTAVSFIQKSKSIDLKGVYYGAHEAPDKPIINMADFYTINDWADGVSQLIDTADASKLAELAESASSDSFQALRDEELIQALKDLTDIVRNIDVNHVAATADRAMGIVREKITQCSGADKQLLIMVEDKFKDLAVSYPPSGRYDSAYFKLQLKLIEMLNTHELYMQSFTVMRELIGSIGMLAVQKGDNRDNGELRKVYAEAFLSALQLKCKWDHDAFKKLNADDLEQVRIFTERFLKDVAGKKKMKSLTYKIKDIRNGFDHAWTAAGPDKKKELENVSDRSIECKDALKKVIDRMNEENIIPTTQEVE